MPYRYLAIGLAILAAFLGYTYAVYSHGVERGELKGNLKVSKLETQIQAGKAQALQVQLDAEHKLAADVASARTERDTANAQITARLSATIASLRNRPERPVGVPEAARPACEGANGAELSGVDGRLLAGLADRAAKQDTALAQCYSILDSIERSQRSKP